MDDYEDDEYKNMTIGEYIRFNLIEDDEVSVEELAEDADVDEDVLNDVLFHGEDLEPDDAYKLAEYFDLPEDFLLEKQVELNHETNDKDDWGEGDDFS